MVKSTKRSSVWSLIRNSLTLFSLIPKLGPSRSFHGSNPSLTDYDPNLAPHIQWTTIPGGKWGTQITLETMANLAREGAQNPKVKAYAASIQTPYAIDGVLRPLYLYRDEEEEIVRTPEFMVRDLETLGYVEGDCDDIATFTASLTKAMNYPTRLTGIQTSTEEYDHVFSEARIGQFWLPIDLTVPPGTEYRVYGLMTEWV
jgi:hypothetical protein